MRKIIKIGDKDYSLKSSAYTQFKYRNDTGKKLLDDVQKITKINGLPDEEQISQMEDVIDVILRIAYIMILEADDKQVGTYDEFLKSIDGLFDNTEWIKEVIELAAAPISGGIQKDPGTK